MAGGTKCERFKINFFNICAWMHDALVITVPAAENIVRLLPPLNLTDDEISQAINRLDAAATQIEAA